jgi:hypothetical protein
VAATALQIELPAVPGADQAVSIDESVAESSAIMRTAVLYGKAAPI